MNENINLSNVNLVSILDLLNVAFNMKLWLMIYGCVMQHAMNWIQFVMLD